MSIDKEANKYKASVDCCKKYLLSVDKYIDLFTRYTQNTVSDVLQPTEHVRVFHLAILIALFSKINADFILEFTLEVPSLVGYFESAEELIERIKQSEILYSLFPLIYECIIEPRLEFFDTNPCKAFINEISDEHA